ncbi:glycogen debranching protein [Paenibacillus aurantius]|uniref:Glycogen debranching protein n=1 Tax=Paenibacillus aurantius TaxID=2918900 RepID=A0AA96LFQ5_9BACL|nr:glycogen debranching protein [Paenibacillus aurantius]WNQ13087.1 glycogen debranching protein [Paenibacillus aurantius]
MIEKQSKHPFNVYLTAGEYIKVIGTQDGHFPDFGHHIANEMGGAWLHPIKLLDGFWLRITDLDREISVWSKADEFISHPWGNQFRYDHNLGHIPVAVERTQFAPELEKGFIARYELFNYSKTETRLNLELLARTDLRPVWFSETLGIRDGKEDVMEKKSDRLALAKDSENDWFVLIGTDLPGDRFDSGQLFGPEFTSGNGRGVKFEATVTLQPQERMTFHLYVAGSYVSKEECEKTYSALAGNYDELLEAKMRACEAVRERAELEVEGEPEFNEIFAWVKWNNQWLVQQVDGYGRGLTAGSPTYPWWFGCDNSYSLQGVLALGDHQLAKDTARLIHDASVKANGNGRIIHEVTTMGAVSNTGNTQETAHYIALVWEMYRWIGEKSILEQNITYCEKGMDWLLGEMDPDGDLLPSGYGIIEIAGLNMELIDSAVYTAKAVQALASMNRELGDKAKAAHYSELAERIVRNVNEMYWNEREGLYADAVAPKKDIVPKVDFMVSLAERRGADDYRAYLEKILDEVEDENEDRGWIINKNWVISTPMEAGIADREKGERAIANMRNEDFIGEYGSYLSGNFTHHMMTISTGVHAVAEARYGHAEASLDLLKRMNRSFSKVLPGSMSEMSPDYGCVVQAWTVYAMVVPVVSHFIGLQPEAYKNQLVIRPNLPSSWEGKWIRLKNVRVGSANVDVSVKSDNGRLFAEIRNESGLEVTVSWNGKTATSRESSITVQL